MSNRYATRPYDKSAILASRLKGLSLTQTARLHSVTKSVVAGLDWRAKQRTRLDAKGQIPVAPALQAPYDPAAQHKTTQARPARRP